MKCATCKGSVQKAMAWKDGKAFCLLGCLDVYEAWKEEKRGGTAKQYLEWLLKGKPYGSFSSYVISTHLMEKYG